MFYQLNLPNESDVIKEWMNSKMKINSKITGSNICNLVVFSYLFLNFIIRIVNNSGILLRMCLLCMLTACVLSFFSIIKKITTVGGYYFLFILSWLVEVISKRNEWTYSAEYFIYTFSYMGIALILVTHKQSVKLYGLLYYAVVLYLTIKILVFGDSIRGLMLDGSSYNFISALVLVYLGTYCIAKIQAGKEFSIVQAVAFMLITCLCFGRGGILTAVVFLSLIVVVKYLKKKATLKKAVFTALVIILIVVFSANILHFLSTSAAFEKFSEKGMESSDRIVIWRSFFRNNFSSFRNFILGSNPLLSFSDGNLHNSFFQMYASFGLPFFLMNVILNICLVVYYSLKRSRNIWMIIIYLTFFLRSNLDKICFRGSCEIIYFCLIFHFLLDIMQSNYVTVKDKKDKNIISLITHLSKTKVATD